MPNWCYNNLSLVHKDPSMITRAVEAFKRGEFCSEFAPMPEGENWYDWNVSEYGTKWDFGEDDEFDLSDPNSIDLSFESAWSPPIAIYEKLQNDFGFEVLAYYYEPGMKFCGKFDKDGDDCYGLEDDIQDVKDNVPDDILEEFSIIDDLEYWAELEEEESEEDEESD